LRQHKENPLTFVTRLVIKLPINGEKQDLDEEKNINQQNNEAIGKGHLLQPQKVVKKWFGISRGRRCRR